MGTTLSTLSPPKGARHRRKRLGRGHGSGHGTTAARGTKGQHSRSGVALGGGFEGGQMPLQRRLPKRGFKNPFRVEYDGVNVGQLATRFEAGAVVDVAALRFAGMVPRNAQRVKVLGNGELTHQLTIKVQAFSKTARSKIEGAGGAAEVVAPVGRRGAA